MSRIIKIFLLLCAAVIIFSCSKKTQEYESPGMVTEVVKSKEEPEPSETLSPADTNYKEPQKPLIQLDDNEVLISTVDLNLDLDTQDEQIIVFKNKNDSEDKIHIAVADFNNVQNKYSRVWETITNAENNRSFMVNLEDLIGDHSDEIICSGRDSEGRTTLDIFWKNTSERNRFSYMPVFNIAKRGTIEINQMERSRGYLQGLKNGISYTITVTSESENHELIISKYYWDFPEKKYLLFSQEKIENTVIVEKQQQEILSGDEIVFFDYITGPWQNGDLIIYFNPKKETATFS